MFISTQRRSKRGNAINNRTKSDLEVFQLQLDLTNLIQVFTSSLAPLKILL